ncbi:hypothetical protein BO70DRAFT_168918 [Aspergillus heteromorphus CBS 117.55]|uniref:Uncharacterized protein n=1 Tax=Aspergillus heteromorphus CBS 117.55 TaxID=1448321 RepID=A0A317V3Y8_9EURO|nr:uncharacterized protein BO70DRAFT_168918 [Aspergillus heteromorphus CBS 117.55]PWY67557.1 hypothetical protein BO70DRAFT_168918 [Aspergillus heteromorphus CBS 117.55]
MSNALRRLKRLRRGPVTRRGRLSRQCCPSVMIMRSSHPLDAQPRRILYGPDGIPTGVDAESIHRRGNGGGGVMSGRRTRDDAMLALQALQDDGLGLLGKTRPYDLLSVSAPGDGKWPDSSGSIAIDFFPKPRPRPRPGKVLDGMAASANKQPAAH